MGLQAQRFEDLGVVRETSVMDEIGLVLTPPSPDQRPAITAGAAFDAVSADASASSPVASVRLARADGLEGSCVSAPTGSGLVFVIDWSPVRWMPSHPAGTRQHLQRAVAGTQRAVVDARTGQVLASLMTGQ